MSRLPSDNFQSPSSEESLHQWLIIIGLVIVVLFILLLCIQCVAKIYRSANVSTRNSMVPQMNSHLRYPNVRCATSKNYARQVLNKYSNYQPIQYINNPHERSIISIHVI
ncbi:unnamed protein product [Rotaria socialis]|uniref:Uncharacterized protein n=1 Tax=Rotaria socialis TaxID=392032 RepID=A0A819Z0M5_9BILA|nr:unnamed protein product [Rotaria socialis]CAF4163655.1 unnamed protein product [Rotaria socialis]